jgi:hypothetical protein
VRQLDTLGASGGSGGVDQGRGRGSGDLVTTSVQFFVGDCRTATGQLVDRTRLDDKNLAEGFCAVGDFLVSLRVLGRFDDQKCRREILGRRSAAAGLFGVSLSRVAILKTGRSGAFRRKLLREV